MSSQKRISGFIIALLFFFITIFPSMQINAESTNVDSKPSELTGVNYKYKQGVKFVPKDLQYKIEDGTDKEITKGADILAPNKTAKFLNEGVNSEASGDRDLAGAKYMVLGKKDTFKPQVGDIYVDEENHTSLKVIDSTISDSKGNQMIPVVSPKVTDVYEYYKIPKQTQRLKRANICDVSPQFSIAPKKANSKRNLTADSQLPENDDDVTITLDQPITLFQYPDSDESTDSSTGKDKNNKDTVDSSTSNISGSNQNDNDHSYKEYDPAKDPAKKANALQDSSSTKGSVVIKLTHASLTVHKPQIDSDVDIGLLTQHVSASVKANIDVKAEIEGDMHLKKEAQILCYGYQIKASDDCLVYIGIFLDIGVDGQIHVTFDVNSSGQLSCGAEANAALGIPYDIHPTGGYKITSFDCGVEVDGELKLWAAGAPQVGIEIMGMDIIKLQLWTGFEGDVKFHLTYNKGDGKNWANIKVDFRAKLTGWLFGYDISIFDFKIPVFDKTLSSDSSDNTVSAETENNNKFRETTYSEIKLEKVDSYSNKVEGLLLVDGKPYKTKLPDAISINVVGTDEENAEPNQDNILQSVKVASDENGKFFATLPIQNGDYVQVKVDDQRVGKEVEGWTDFKKAESPFDHIDLNADAFNDVLTGSISGNYSDPDGKPDSGDEILYTSRVFISKTNENDGTSADYTVAAKKGDFVAPMPLQEGDVVKVIIKPFGNDEEISATAYPNLDSLSFRAEKELDPKSSQKMLIIRGAIYNNGGSKPYDGDVKLSYKNYGVEEEKTVKVKVQYNTVPDTITQNSGKGSLNKNGPKISVPLKKVVTPGSSFEFDNVKNYKFNSVGGDNQHILLTIIYDGLEKQIGWGAWDYPEVQNPEKEIKIENPEDEITDPVIDPEENMDEDEIDVYLDGEVIDEKSN